MNMSTLIAVDLFFTFVLIGLSWLILEKCVPVVLESFNRRHARQWLLLGISLGFIGKILDNAWWAPTWISKLKHWHTEEWWFHHGPISNLAARHVLGILSAACHLIAIYIQGFAGLRELWSKITVVVVLSAIVWLLVLR